MKVALIVAVDNENGIGKNNDLLWRLPADMLFFKETTTDHIVVTGRKNYESIPEKFRPLPNRENAILTRNGVYEAPDCMIFHSLEDCLEYYKNEEKRTVFIIGGGQIYREALLLDVVDEMYITHVDVNLDADTFFSKFDVSKWNVEKILQKNLDEKNPYSFTIRKYLKKNN